MQSFAEVISLGSFPEAAKTLADIGSGASFSEPLRNAEISYDQEKNRPLLIVLWDAV